MSNDRNILKNCNSGCDDCCSSIEIKRINSIIKYIMDNALFTGGNNSDLENDSNFISCDVLEGCLKRQDIRNLISLIVSGDIAWGNIKGNILNQTDLTNILNGKFDNPNGASNDYLDGTGTPTPFPNFLECDDLEHCPEIIGIKNSIPEDISDLTDNSGSLFDGDYDSLSNKPTFKTVDGQSILGVGNISVGDNNVQSDWNESNPLSDAFIKNKPTLPAVNNGQLELNTSGIATGGTQSFSANQAGNTIFTVDVPGTDITLSFNNNILTVSSSTGQSDNIDLSSLVTADTYVVSMSLSGNTLILTNNDSTTVQQDLSSILFDGDYNNLSNKPTIPTDVSDLSDNGGILFSGDYDDLTNKPTFKTVDGQSILGVGDIEVNGIKNYPLILNLWTEDLEEGLIYKYIQPFDFEFIEFIATVETAPDGADIEIEITLNSNNYTLTIVDGSNVGTLVLPASETLSVGDLFSMEITQIGSVEAGKGLVINPRGKTI